MQQQRLPIFILANFTTIASNSVIAK